jgi:ATP-dependent DNA helicase RecG
MSTALPFVLSTRLTDLYKHGFTGLGPITTKKLTEAVAAFSGKPTAKDCTVEDLLNYLPMRYEDRSKLGRIADLRDGAEVSLELWTRIAGGFQVGKNRGPKQPKLFIFEITASDPANSGKPVVIWWFVSGRNATDIIAYHRKRFERGSRFIVFGKWEWDARRNTFALRLNKPDEIEMISASHDEQAQLVQGAEEDDLDDGDFDEEPDDISAEKQEVTDPTLAAIHVGRCVPVYRKLGPLKTKRLREIIYQVLARLSDSDIKETLPADLLLRQRLCSKAEALKHIHFPPENATLAEYESARSPAHIRLIFEEFFWVALAIALRRSERVKEPKGAVIEISEGMRARMQKTLPFELTGAQSKVLEQIFADMQSDSPMNRLLQGDVGSGKTIVAVQAMLAAMENGYQAALMAPTEILAEQHARNIKRILAKTPYRIELLTGTTRASERRKLQTALSAGEIHSLIGTHALIQDAVGFNNLGLAVIDEQHRFGVLQRAELRTRGFNPDVLVMTATPIPRSLAMTLYGDLEVSVIDELPPGRTPVKTVVCGEDQRAGIYKGLEREIRKGRQAYVVYPLVEESESMDLKDATRMFEHLRDRVFPHFAIGLLHGQMKAIEKEEVMRKFVGGQIQILVATTVIEVGVDVPNAALMVIEHAERFGLSQLHQLRGRVGRGAEQSFCVLLASDKQTSAAKARLGIMEETTDGFRIAEKDLEIRGPGEVMGTRQAGIPTFRIGNLVRDLKILEQAKREADDYLGGKRRSREAMQLVAKVRSDAKFGLAAIG